MTRRREVRSKRSSPFANRKSASGDALFPEMRDWCRGKWWFPRLIFLGWFAYMWFQLIQNPNYPVLFGGINLGIHELGHMIWMPFGEFMMFVGGSLTQCLAPIAAMIVFYRQSEYFGIAFGFGWLSTNLYNLSVYIGDARSQGLPLVTPGGGEPRHDWHYLLGKVGLLEADRMIAGLTNGLAFVSMLIFMVVGGYQIWLMFTLSPEREHLREVGTDDDDEL